MKKAILIIVSLLPMFLAAQETQKSTIMEAIMIKTPAFTEGGMIPAKFTCEGENIFPRIDWSSVPAGTKSLALIVDDPDAPNGDWVHFVLFNIPADIHKLDEGFKVSSGVPAGVKSGKNSSGKLDYHGPCPPSGTHRYYFKLYALDVVLDQAQGIDKYQLLKVMEGHVLGFGELMGKYRREK